MKYREHFLQFFYNLGTSIKNNFYTFIPMIIGVFGSNNRYEKWIYGAFITFSIIMIFFSFQKWRKRTLDIHQEFIELSEGVFSRKHNQIPIQNIQNIYTESTLIKRLFRVTTLKIEVLGSADIQFDLNSRKIEEIKEKLGNEKSAMIQTEQGNGHFRFSFIDLFVMSTVAKYTFGTMAILFALLIFASDFLPKTTETKKTEEQNIIEKVETINEANIGLTLQFEHFQIQTDGWKIYAFVGILVVFVLYVISYPLTFLNLYVKYRNYKIERIQNKLVITYGFLKRVNYEVTIKRVRNLSFNQNLFQKCIGYGQLYIETAGSKEANRLMFPIIKEKRIEETLQKYLPEFKWDVEMDEPKNETFFLYIKNYFLFSSFVFAILTYVLGFEKIHLAIYLLIFYGILNWRYSGLYFDQQKIKIRKTGVMGFKTKLFRKKFIEHTEVEQWIWHKKKNIMNYRFSVFSESEEEEYSIVGLSDKNKEMFLNYLKNK